MNKLLMLITCCLTFLVTPSAFALNIDIYDDVSNLIILEDFEQVTAGWHETLDTKVGEFKATGQIGTGATSYNADEDNAYSTLPHFSIQNSEDLGENYWYGRYNTTEGGTQWLDSGDITALTLDVDIDSSFTSLFFYMQDPSDCGATTTVNGVTNYVAMDFNLSTKDNASSFLVGITWELGETLESITFSTGNHQGDGYGLDDFATLAPAPVPEPATMFLLGFGLIGLAGFRKKSKK